MLFEPGASAANASPNGLGHDFERVVEVPTSTNPLFLLQEDFPLVTVEIVPFGPQAQTLLNESFSSFPVSYVYGKIEPKDQAGFEVGFFEERVVQDADGLVAVSLLGNAVGGLERQTPQPHGLGAESPDLFSRCSEVVGVL